MLNVVLAEESYLFSELELATFARYRALSCASDPARPTAPDPEGSPPDRADVAS